MWATENNIAQQHNDLYRLAAVTSVLLALFLFAGASGHLVAIWPEMSATDAGATPRQWLLLVPGLVLAIGCVANGTLALGLWLRRALARNIALLVNAACAAYFAYLLAKGVPGHPIGIFLSLVLSQILILSGLLLGLVWPSGK